jgi:hypothetical protein
MCGNESIERLSNDKMPNARSFESKPQPHRDESPELAVA